MARPLASRLHQPDKLNNRGCPYRFHSSSSGCTAANNADDSADDSADERTDERTDERAAKISRHTH